MAAERLKDPRELRSAAPRNFPDDVALRRRKRPGPVLRRSITGAEEESALEPSRGANAGSHGYRECGPWGDCRPRKGPSFAAVAHLLLPPRQREVIAASAGGAVAGEVLLLGSTAAPRESAPACIVPTKQLLPSRRSFWHLARDVREPAQGQPARRHERRDLAGRSGTARTPVGVRTGTSRLLLSDAREYGRAPVPALRFSFLGREARPRTLYANGAEGACRIREPVTLDHR